MAYIQECTICGKSHQTSTVCSTCREVAGRMVAQDKIASKKMVREESLKQQEALRTKQLEERITRSSKSTYA